MTKCLSATLACLGVSLCAATAAPRVALVRVKEIYSKHPATLRLQQDTKQEREQIMKDARADDLRRALDELNQIQAKLGDKANPPDEETARRLAREYELKRQEAQTLQREFEAFRTEREKEINRGMVAGMRETLNLITDISRKLAKERGYDILFDSSGNTNTGVPCILHHDRSADLTEDVTAALEDLAAASAAKAAPATDKPAPKKEEAKRNR